MTLKLNKNHKYLLACSYGPDSMALFAMLLKEGYNFSAALVNYNLREESKEERDNFIKYCEQNGVTFHYLDVEIYNHENIEKQCRQIRYNFFKELNGKHNYDALLVAHNMDDHIETYIMQKRRKNIVNYYGISELSLFDDMHVIRPLLNFTKQELMDYCLANNVPFSIDKSNLTDKYERNKIRHEIIEKLNVDEKQNIVQEISNENEKLHELHQQLLALNLSDVSQLKRLNKEELSVAFTLLMKNNNIYHPISFELSKELRKIVISKKPNIISTITENVFFVKSYSHCYFTNDISGHLFSYVINKPIIIDNEFFFLDLTGDTSNRKISEDSYPFVIRNAKPDDVYEIKGYKKTFKRLFIDWKVPLELRGRYPVFEKNGKIFYTPRYQKDFKMDNFCNFYIK